jgi:long-chain fatty acid transport protein
MRRALFLLLIGSSTAYAGGVMRPSGISARGTGMGGAWAAWADDATAVWFNPGALDTVDSQVMLGGEYVLGPRSYTPVAADGTKGPEQSTTLKSPAPAVGAVGRITEDDEPSRFTFAIGAWNTFGGTVDWTKTGMAALDSTKDICFEIDAGVGMHISDRLAIGGAVRLGIGLFHIASTMMPFDADLSASGVGFSGSLGALFRPTDDWRVGLSWRAPMNIATKGNGTVTVGGSPERHDITHDQTWPQVVSLAVGNQVTPEIRLAAQVDWEQWSEMDTITVNFPNGVLPNQIYPEYWQDSWTFRLGGQYAFGRRAELRAGAYFDSQAVPDRTLERQYLDTNKFGASAGGTVRIGDWRLDAAVDGIIPTTRTVPNNATDVMGFTVLQNKAPGDYIGTLISFELAAVRTF